MVEKEDNNVKNFIRVYDNVGIFILQYSNFIKIKKATKDI
jgi:hypothetical protein